MTAARIKSTAKYTGSAVLATGAGLGLAGQPGPLVVAVVLAGALLQSLPDILPAAGAAAKDFTEAAIRLAVANQVRQTPPAGLDIAALIDVTLNGASTPAASASAAPVPDPASPPGVAARESAMPAAAASACSATAEQAQESLAVGGEPVTPQPPDGEPPDMPAGRSSPVPTPPP